jgi:carboxymethylenebutenolidase
MLKINSFFLLICVLFLSSGLAGFAQVTSLPPAEAGAKEKLSTSPRHGEWVIVPVGGKDKVEVWVVYPERKEKAPVVIVIHEILGLSDWIRAVTDQLAAEGFIALAPDFLSGKGPEGKGSSAINPDTVRTLIRDLQSNEIVSRLNAVAKYASSLPASSGKFGTVGFCWGGGISFDYATEQPDLDAAVVYYGTSPAKEKLSRINAPVLGLYGGDDARVNATIPDADTEMKRLKKSYTYQIFEGAGHAFLRMQEGREGANLRATQQAWPLMVQALKNALNAPPK